MKMDFNSSDFLQILGKFRTLDISETFGIRSNEYIDRQITDYVLANKAVGLDTLITTFQVSDPILYISSENSANSVIHAGNFIYSRDYVSSCLEELAKRSGLWPVDLIEFSKEFNIAYEALDLFVKKYSEVCKKESDLLITYSHWVFTAESLQDAALQVEQILDNDNIGVSANYKSIDDIRQVCEKLVLPFEPIYPKLSKHLARQNPIGINTKPLDSRTLALLSNGWIPMTEYDSKNQSYPTEVFPLKCIAISRYKLDEYYSHVTEHDWTDLMNFSEIEEGDVSILLKILQQNFEMQNFVFAENYIISALFASKVNQSIQSFLWEKKRKPTSTEVELLFPKNLELKLASLMLARNLDVLDYLEGILAGIQLRNQDSLKNQRDCTKLVQEFRNQISSQITILELNLKAIQHLNPLYSELMTALTPKAEDLLNNLLICCLSQVLKFEALAECKLSLRSSRPFISQLETNESGIFESLILQSSNFRTFDEQSSKKFFQEVKQLVSSQKIEPRNQKTVIESQLSHYKEKILNTDNAALILHLALLTEFCKSTDCLLETSGSLIPRILSIERLGYISEFFERFKVEKDKKQWCIDLKDRFR